MSKIAIRLEVAADAALPRSLPQRQVNEKQASREISRAEALPDDTHSPIGQRQMKRMSVETYTPSTDLYCSNYECVYARCTLNNL